MSVGRPPKGSDHVNGLEGADAEKKRLRIVLETLSGERSVEQACADGWRWQSRNPDGFPG